MAIGTLTLGSNTTFDFVYITRGQTNEIMKLIEYEPVWNADSKFLAKFDHTLMTGNLDAGGTPPTSWAVYRQRVDTSEMAYVATIEGKEAVCHDYMASNGIQYIYHSFAQTESDMSEDKRSKLITPNWPGWYVITLRPSTFDPEAMEPDEIFMFQYNLEVGDINNSTIFNRLENFTRYPFIQRSSANALTGTLKGFIGTVRPDGQYVDTLDQANALQRLTTNTQRKLLKDLKGHVMEVDLVGAMNFSVTPGVGFEPYAASVQWTEVADATKLRVLTTEELVTT